MATTTWTPKLMGLRLQQLREERHLTLRPLSEAIEAQTGVAVSKAELSRIERGLRGSSGIQKVVAICDFFQVRLEWLVFGTGPREYPSHRRVRDSSG